MAWQAAAIAAGSQLLGGVMQDRRTGQANHQQRSVLKNQLQWKVADAKKAGIHPLYAVGAPSVTGNFSTGSGMGDAIANAGETVGRYLGGRDERSRAQQMHAASLLESRARIASETSRARLNNARANEILRTRKASDLARAVQGVNARPTQIDPSLPTTSGTEQYTTSPRSFKRNAYDRPGWMTTPGMPSAQSVQDEYGELGETVYGGLKFPIDGVYNLWRATRDYYRSLEFNERMKRHYRGPDFRGGTPPDQYGP